MKVHLQSYHNGCQFWARRSILLQLPRTINDRIETPRPMTKEIKYKTYLLFSLHARRSWRQRESTGQLSLSAACYRIYDLSDSSLQECIYNLGWQNLWPTFWRAWMRCMILSLRSKRSSWLWILQRPFVKLMQHIMQPFLPIALLELPLLALARSAEELKVEVMGLFSKCTKEDVTLNNYITRSKSLCRSRLVISVCVIWTCFF